MSVSITRLKEYLSIDLYDVSKDILLNEILEGAKSYVEDYIQYPLQPKDITIKKEGTNTSILVLPHSKINSLTSVKELNIDENQSTDITSEIYLFSEEGYIKRKKNLFLSIYYYEITYNVGFSIIPKDLEQAVYMVALSLYAQTDNAKSGVSRIATPDGTFTYNFEILTPAITSILDRYRVKCI